MRYHPVVLMLVVWGLCIAAFTILPFQLENRVMSLYGFFILSLFIAVFCAGALAAALPQAQKPRRRDVTVDFRLADRALMAAGVIAILASLIDTSGRNVLDLADAYQIRSERAGNLMAGDERGGSIWFQLAFLTYPASYIYLVREIGFRARPVLWKVVVFGLMPVTMASLAMGGRAPLFYALLMLIYGFALRKHTFPKGKPGAPGVGPQAVVRPRRKPLLPFRLTAPVKVAIGVLGAVMMIYFVQVFLTRADVAGGAPLRLRASERPGHRAHVPSRAERLASRAADHHRLHGRIPRPRVQPGMERPAHLQGQRVERLGAVEGDKAHGPPGLQQHVLAHARGDIRPGGARFGDSGGDMAARKGMGRK